MNINRHNYEAFFLLYVDNELPDIERKAVEIFVQENTDLQMELDMLLSTVLPIDRVLFSSKESLYKNGSGVEAVQEDLLMYLDNELDSACTKKVEEKIKAGGKVKKEWDELKQTILKPELVVFKNKRILYRHEQGRLVSMRFWRMAAAAALIIGLLFTGISVYRNGQTQNDFFVKNEARNTAPENVTTKKNNLSDIQSDKEKDIASEDNGKAQTKAIADVADAVDQSYVSDQNVIKADRTKNKKHFENINTAESNKTVTAAVLNKRSEIVYVNMAPDELPERSVTTKVKSPSVPVIDYNPVQAIPDSYATTASFSEAPENNNQILYMSEERLSRSKVGGLFRKVKRVIERSTTIKTGNGVTIGGFEIALK